MELIIFTGYKKSVDKTVSQLIQKFSRLTYFINNSILVTCVSELVLYCNFTLE